MSLANPADLDRLVRVVMETTGLDPATDLILEEVAVTIIGNRPIGRREPGPSRSHGSPPLQADTGAQRWRPPKQERSIPAAAAPVGNSNNTRTGSPSPPARHKRGLHWKLP